MNSADSSNSCNIDNNTTIITSNTTTTTTTTHASATNTSAEQKIQINIMNIPPSSQSQQLPLQTTFVSGSTNSSTTDSTNEITDAPLFQTQSPHDFQSPSQQGTQQSGKTYSTIACLLCR